MKSKCLVIAILLTVFFSCDTFRVPMEARLNPNDSQNPIPAALNVGAIYGNDGAGTFGAKITWSEPAVEYSIITEGYIVVRKPGSAPQTIFDGVVAGLFDAGANDYSYLDDRNAEGYPVGRRVYYSVFAYGPKQEDLDDDAKLEIDESGIIVNYQNYDFTGPVSDSIDIWTSEDLPVSVDGHIDGGGKNTTSQFLQVYSTGTTPELISFITFNLDNFPSGNFEVAQLILTNNTTSTNGQMDVFSLDWNWEDFSTFAVANAATAFRYWTMDITNGIEEEFKLDVTDTVNDWIEGEHDNNGFKLVTTDSDMDFVFSSNEGPNPPILRIWYWEQ